MTEAAEIGIPQSHTKKFIENIGISYDDSYICVKAVPNDETVQFVLQSNYEKRLVSKQECSRILSQHHCLIIDHHEAHDENVYDMLSTNTSIRDIRIRANVNNINFICEQLSKALDISRKIEYLDFLDQGPYMEDNNLHIDPLNMARFFKCNIEYMDITGNYELSTSQEDSLLRAMESNYTLREFTLRPCSDEFEDKVSVILSRNFELMPHRVHRRVLEFGIILCSYLPAYVMLEIFDWLPYMSLAGHRQKVSILQGICNTRRKLKDSSSYEEYNKIRREC